MNEDELRSLIRVAIQKQMDGDPSSIRLEPDTTGPIVAMSFAQYPLERAVDDTMCIIEPAVRCNHCGFCKCHGH